MNHPRTSFLLTFFVTWFYVGKLPKMPGTWGSLAALPVIWLLHDKMALSIGLISCLFFLSWIAIARYLTVTLAKAGAQGYTQDLASRNDHASDNAAPATLDPRFRGGDTGENDPQEIVVDEVIGQWIALLCIPQSIEWFIAGFFLFRFFDIVKPFPVSWADNLKGSLYVNSLGILLDDVFAGLMTLSLLQGLLYYLS
jgi:phosphatidylglycerophosphatase A